MTAFVIAGLFVVTVVIAGFLSPRSAHAESVREREEAREQRNAGERATRLRYAREDFDRATRYQ